MLDNGPHSSYKPDVHNVLFLSYTLITFTLINSNGDGSQSRQDNNVFNLILVTNNLFADIKSCVLLEMCFRTRPSFLHNNT